MLMAISKMRQDTTGTYHLLMRVFAPAIVTSGHIKNEIANGALWTAAVTETDEAFILLALKNGWNTWAPEHLKITAEGWHQTRPLWSEKHRGGNWCKFVGWDPVALQEYSALMAAVHQDRCSEETGNNNFNATMRQLIIPTLSKVIQDRLEKGTYGRYTSCTDETSSGQLDHLMENID